jgi:hypothetical protein
VKTKVINGLIHALSLSLSLTGISLVLVFQYFKDAEISTKIKIALPILLAGMFVTLVTYGWIKDKIKMRLQAIETVKELGQVGATGTITKNLLGAISYILPLIWVAVILVVVGEFTTKTGIILLEVMAIAQVTTFGNVIADLNTKSTILKEKAAQEDVFAQKVAANLKGDG